MTAVSKDPFNRNVRNGGLDIVRDHVAMREGPRLAKQAQESEKAKLTMREERSDWPFPTPVRQDIKAPDSETRTSTSVGNLASATGALEGAN